MNQSSYRLNTANLISIDIARGFAAFSVFTYHYGLGKVCAEKTGLHWLNYLDTIGAQYAVPLFFLISGFCIHLSQLRLAERLGQQSLNLKEYFTRRFWRIYPPYFILLLFSCSMLAIKDNVLSLGDFFSHILVIQGLIAGYFNTINLVLWTITIEILFYLLYPVWYRLYRCIGLDFALLTGLIVSLISCLVCASFFYPYSLPTRYFVLNLWGAWVFGAWLADKMSQGVWTFFSMKWWGLGVALLFTFVLISQYGVDRLSLFGYSFKICIWAWPLTCLIRLEPLLGTWLRKKYGLIILVCRSVGISSYSLYLLHMPLMDLRNELWKNITSQTERNIFWLGWFILIPILAWVSYQLFERLFFQYRQNPARPKTKAKFEEDDIMQLAS